MFFYSFIWVWTILNCHFIFRYRFHFKLHLPSVLTLNAWFSSFMALKWNSFCCHSFFFLLFCLLELLLLVEFVMFLIPTTFKFNYIYWIKTRENISSCFQSKIESSMQSCRHKHTNKEEKNWKNDIEFHGLILLSVKSSNIYDSLKFHFDSQYNISTNIWVCVNYLKHQKSNQNINFEVVLNCVNSSHINKAFKFIDSGIV
jgi:hypothetical protein